MFTKEKILKELQKIQRSIPTLYREKVVSEESLTPNIKMVMEKALEDPDFPEEKKEAIRDLKDKGYFDQKTITEDPKIVRKIDLYLEREYKKAIKEGRLPTKKQMKEILHDKKGSSTKEDRR